MLRSDEWAARASRDTRTEGVRLSADSHERAGAASDGSRFPSSIGRPAIPPTHLDRLCELVRDLGITDYDTTQATDAAEPTTIVAESRSQRLPIEWSYSAVEAGIELAVWLSGSRVTIDRVRVSGTISGIEFAFWRLYADSLVGTSLGDASDNSVARLEFRLRGERPVPGVTLPGNAGEYFGIPLRLIRSIAKQQSSIDPASLEPAIFDDTPRDERAFERNSRPRLAGDPAIDDGLAGQLEVALQQCLMAACRDQHISPMLVRIARVRDPFQLYLDVDRDIGVAEQGVLLRRLESLARERVDPCVSVFLEASRDRNRLRRKSTP